MNESLYNEIKDYDKDQLIAGLALLMTRRHSLKDELSKVYADEEVYKKVLQEKNIIKFTNSTM